MTARWFNGLDEAQDLLGVGDIGQAQLAVGGAHLQPVTSCHGFIALGFQALLQLAPVGRSISAFSESLF